MSEPPDITRLIEEGLTKYGAGDLDGALLVWEQVLAVDPDNAQASSYVDYVRANYELLVTGGDAAGDAAPFGIADEPEYQIEIVPGQVVPAEPSAAYLDAIDEGWDIESEATHAKPRSTRAPSVVTYELEAEEPAEPPGVSFDDATREYPGGAGRPPALLTVSAEPPSDFQLEETTGGFNTPQPGSQGFGTQTTDVRKRELGFVQPAQPDVQAGVRTPTLPQVNPSRPPAPITGAPSTSAPTTPPPTRRDKVPPPARDNHVEPVIGTAPTVDFETYPPVEVDPRSDTRELADRPGSPAMIAATTQRLPDLRRQFAEDDPLTSVPTREIGQRPPTVDEDMPTGEADVRAIRAFAAGPRPFENTNHDVVLPFDPIDARAAQIIAEVDAGAPKTETKDDRLRRRIAGFVERALAWNGIGELDRAVAAIDLALSEEPASALAQKLVQRNRDTIMLVFQSFLGDLSRQPQLTRPLHELSSAPISPRAAFLLSRVDGTLSIDEILDVSGMPRMEAYRYLSQLYLRGILK